MNVITVWVNESWDHKEASDFINDLSRWIVEAGYGTNGPEEALRSIVTATEVEMKALSQEEFVQLVAGGQGIVVIPRSDQEEPEAYIPPAAEPDVPDEPATIPTETEMGEYARGFQDGHEAGRREGYDEGYTEGYDAAQKAGVAAEGSD